MAGILGNTRRPDVTFYRSGRIDITSRVAKLLDLHDGDVVDIDKHSGEWLLFVRHRNDKLIGAHEARCYASKKNSRNYRAYSKRLCDAVLTEVGVTEIARLAAGESVDFSYYGVAVPLITCQILSHYDTRSKV